MLTIIFTVLVNVESVGALKSSVLFIEAVKVLKEKCKTFIEELNKAQDVTEQE